MLEWLAIIVGFVVLHRFRERVDRMEEVIAELRDAVSSLRAPATPGAPVVPPTAPPRAPASMPVAASVRPAAEHLPPPLPPSPSAGFTARGPERRASAPAAPAARETPPSAPFDWEQLIGVKLFSWIAAAALALAGVFFLKYSVEHGWLSPTIRMGIGLITGVALLVACELKVARRYAHTANAMDAAGIAILFATVFASYALWHLVPSAAAFALLVIVTGVAVLLSIRRESMFIALLGLVGGFSTPVLLASGHDNPIGLFSYLLVLNAGLAWVAYRRRWPLLTALSVGLSALYQLGWVAKFLSADKLPLAMGIFLLFPLVAVVAFAFGGRRLGSGATQPASPLFDDALFGRTVCASAMVPLLFSLYLAAVPAYGARFGLLFGFLFCLAAGLLIVAIAQGPQWLHALGALTTLATFAIWFSTSYSADAWPWILGIVSVFVLLHLAAPLSASRWGRALEGVSARAVLVAPALLFTFPLLFALEPRVEAPGAPFGVLLVLAAACAAVAIRARAGVLHYVAALFVIAAQAVWSSRYLDEAHLHGALLLYGVFGVFHLAVPVLARHWSRPLRPAGASGVVTISSIALLGFLAAGSVAAAGLWGLAILLALLTVGVHLESSAEGKPAIATMGTMLSWLVLAVWLRTAGSAISLSALVVITGFALLSMAGAAWARRRVDDEETLAGEFEHNIFLGLVGHVFLAFVLLRPELALPPWPVLGALTVLNLATVVVALHLRTATLHVAAMAATMVTLMLWATVANVAPWPVIAVAAALGTVLLAYAAVWAARRIGATGFERAAGIAALLAQGVVIVAQLQPGSPGLATLVAAQVTLVVAVLALSWLDAERHGALAAIAVLPAAVLAALWQLIHPTAADWARQLALAVPVYLAFAAYPLLLGKRVGRAVAPYLATVLANAALLLLARHSLILGGYGAFVGALPVSQALLLVPVLAQLVRMERTSAGGARSSPIASGRLALVAAATLAAVTVAIPLQLDKHWITIGWALEGAALVWLYRRIPHSGLIVAAIALLATVFVRLALNPAVLTYHARGAMPLLNWYLYTYLVCAGALFVAAYLVRDRDDMRRMAAILSSGATVLLFLLLNIEIADYYAAGPTITFNFNANLAQDLTYTIGWALFAIGLLAAGIRLRTRAARMASISLLAITVAKCFLHDLGRLGGLYRISSFVGLALSLALVAIVLQKFVLARDDARLTEA